MVVGQLEVVARVEVADGDGVAGPVDGEHLVVHPDVEGEAVVQRLRGLQQQVGALLDDAARGTADLVGVGHVAAAFEHGDLGVLGQAAQAGRRAHAAGDTPDDDDSHDAQLYPVGYACLTSPPQSSRRSRHVPSSDLPQVRQDDLGGCGQHVDSVMRGVPSGDRCKGHEGEPSTGFFSKLFGR